MLTNLVKAKHLQAAKGSALRAIDLDIEGLKVVRGEISEGTLGACINECTQLILASTGRLIVVGMGKSGHIGRKLAATFSSTGTPAHFVHAAEASHGDLGMISRDDIVLALSWSGETGELADVVSYTQRFGVPLVAMTAGENSTLARSAAVTLLLPKVKEACPNGLAPTTSTLLQLAVGDAIAIALLEAKGFSAADFRTFHPGGKLGAQLSYVSNLMHVPPRVPLVVQGTSMTEAVRTINSSGFGVVGIINGAGELVGVITDGDIRRHVADGMLEMRVDDVMSTSPKTITAQAFASHALEIMQTQQISVLLVVEDRRPVGIIHMLDLLRAGVA